MEKYLLIGSVLLLLIAPGRAGMLDGIPLDTLYELTIITVAMVFLFFFPIPSKLQEHQRIYFNGLLIIILVVTAGKLYLGATALPRGLTAFYYYPSYTKEALQRSTQFIHMGDEGTRRDTVIDFTLHSNHPFPLWFLNNTDYATTKAPHQSHMPFEALWNGYLEIPSEQIKEGVARVTIETIGTTTITIPGLPTTTTSTETEIIFTAKTLIPFKRLVPITIRYSAPPSPEKSLHIRWTTNDKPVTEWWPHMYSTTMRNQDTMSSFYHTMLMLGGLFSALIAISMLLAKAAWRPWIKSPKPWATVLLCMGIIIFGHSLTESMQSPYFNFLYAGHDPLSYETYARHIQLTGDWIMKAHETESYYYQPYYYFLAPFHYIGGEPLTAPLFFQGVLLGLAAIMIFCIGRKLMNDNALSTSISFIAAVALIVHKPLQQEVFLLFPTITGVFLATATILTLLHADSKKSSFIKGCIYIGAGTLFGISIIARFNFLIWLPFIILWLLCLYGIRKSWYLGSFILGTAISLTPFILRNWIVDGYARLVSKSNTTINFIKAVAAPHDYTPTTIRYPYIHDFVFETLNVFDRRATTSLEWIFNHPKDYFWHLVNQLSSTFMNPWIGVPFLGFLLGSALYLLRSRKEMAFSKRAHYLLLGGFVVVQIATIVIGSDNSERYYLPLIPIMILFTSFVLYTAIPYTIPQFKAK